MVGFLTALSRSEAMCSAEPPALRALRDETEVCTAPVARAARPPICTRHQRLQRATAASPDPAACRAARRAAGCECERGRRGGRVWIG